MTMGVYGIFDAVTNECFYVGQSVKIETRWYHHRRDLKRGEHQRTGLQEFYDEHSLDRLSFRVLVECKGEELLDQEVKWFEELKPKFWGNKPCKTWKWSNRGPEAMAKAMANRTAKALEQFEFVDAEWGDRVIELYHAGETSESITTIIPLSFATVLRILNHRKVTFRSKREAIGFEYSRGKTDDELRSELKALRAEGLSWPQIAKQWSCGDTTLKNLIRDLGIYEAPPKFALADLTDEQVKTKLLELDTKGLSPTQMAKELGIGRTTVFRKLHKYLPERFSKGV